jgi:hypothetical protein
MPRFKDTSLQNSKPSVDRKNRKKNAKNFKTRTNDPAALEMLEFTTENNIITAFDRWSAQQPQCAFGYQGICCRICFAGPCRVKGLEGPGSMGICGARDYTIVARNAIRMMAGGASAHSDHGRELVEVLYHMSEGKAPDYEIRDADKLHRVAKKIGLEMEGKSDLELAREVALEAFAVFFDPQRIKDVFFHRHPGEKGVILKNKASVGPWFFHPVPSQDYFASIGVHKAAQHSKQCCFSTAGWTQEGNKLPLLHSEGDIIQNNMTAAGLMIGVATMNARTGPR